MNLKTNRPTQATELVNKITNELYHLEDLTNYSSRELSDIIEKFKSIKILRN